MNQPKHEQPTYTKGPVSKIGETGGTVVYIFPGGKACVKKGKKGKKTVSQVKASETPARQNPPKKAATMPMPTAPKPSEVSTPPSPPSPFSTQRTQRVGDRLVEAGAITSNQLQVALYDQKTMKLRLGDVLIARGWIDQATLDQVLSD